ncbi:Cytochrome P450 [Trinorchestia longiramus]|nr:Cytochrome P450 [Trinorchestia longiramus]
MILEIILLLGLLVLLWSVFRKPARMPPGSFGIPVLGELPFGSVSITQHLAQLRSKRGNIFTTKWGSHPVVILADFKLIRKAFNHADLQGRPHFFSFTLLKHFRNIGVIDSDGPAWSENRRFLLRHLRDLGMGKTTLEDSIHDEAAMLVDHLETCVDKPTVMDVFINGAVLNVIWQMLASTRFDINDKEIQEHIRAVEETCVIMNGPIFLLDICPRLVKILPTFIKNKVMKVDIITDIRDRLFGMFKKIVAEHLKSLDAGSPRDIIDHYLISYPDRDSSGYLLEEDEYSLIATIGDMFVAGSETTSSTIRWMILYMAINPKIQAKIHKRLDEVVPAERLPCLNDRSQLQYLDAMILDVLRLSSSFPLGLPHKATEDITLEGYAIPKDTLVMACAEMCHHDPAVWEEPDKLNPDHFLDQDGNLDSKKDGFLPFSIGRRQCLGESLARMELFLFASAILQRFTIEPPEGVTIVPEVDHSQIFLNLPKRTEVILRKRI